MAGEVRALSTTQREVAMLRLNGWKLLEIARRTGKSLGTVKRTWYRGRERLKAGLRHYLEW